MKWFTHREALSGIAHLYQIDFGAAVARYLGAFFVNIHRDEVNRRLERAQHAASAWRSAP
jgi:hypothetical protein